MAKKEEDPLFVGITNADELRRSVLECSKDILESLRSYEKFKSLKEEKLKLIHQFRSDVKEVAKLINAIKGSLPNVREDIIKKPEAKKVKDERIKTIRVEKPIQRTELERLEEELDEIEGKLNSIS